MTDLAGYGEIKARHTGTGNGPEADQRPIEVIQFADMRPRLGGRPLIKGVLECEQTSVIVGTTGVGKTFLALDIGLHVATGTEWFSRRVAGGGVIYVAAEAGRSIVNRVAAWKLSKGYDLSQRVPFAAVTTPVDLCHADTGDLDRLVAAIRGAGMAPIALTVIDTISRALSGGDENSSADMGAIVRSLDRIRDEFRCHVCAVHHLGKDPARGARGHSLLISNLDTAISVERDDGARISTATLTKQRDGPVGASISFRLHQIELGRDADGDPVTSCVVEKAEGPTVAARNAVMLSPAQKRALELLADALARGGEVPAADNHIPANVPCVSEIAWREVCYRGSISDGSQDAKQKAFKRAAEALIAGHYVGKWGDLVWLAKPGQTGQLPDMSGPVRPVRM